MKRYVLIALLVITSNVLFAQGGMRINLYGAYAFDDYFEVYSDSYNYYHGTLEGGFQWGAGFEFNLRPEYGLELLYYRQDTHAPTTWQSGAAVLSDYENLAVAANYILLGGNRRVIKGNAELYGGLMGGVAIHDISNEASTKSTSVTKFAWGLRGGVNIWTTETIGIKLQAQLISAVQAAGGGAYIGTGGTGVGVSTYSTIYQFGLGGGLTFKMGRRAASSEM
jgi:hypothetical protein